VGGADRLPDLGRQICWRAGEVVDLGAGHWLSPRWALAWAGERVVFASLIRGPGWRRDRVEVGLVVMRPPGVVMSASSGVVGPLAWRATAVGWQRGQGRDRWRSVSSHSMRALTGSPGRASHWPQRGASTDEGEPGTAGRGSRADARAGARAGRFKGWFLDGSGAVAAPRGVVVCTPLGCVCTPWACAGCGGCTP
jgi:hypothetical protein